MRPYELLEEIQGYEGELRASLQPLEDEDAGDPPASPLTAIEVGQIWAIDPGDRPGMRCLVLVTSFDGEEKGFGRGVLVVDRVWMASVDDVLVPADEGTVGVPLLACTWRDVRFAQSMAHHCLGTIDQGVLDAVKLLVRARIEGRVPREPVDLLPREAITGDTKAPVKWMRWRARDVDGAIRTYFCGPRIVDEDDPRPELRSLLVQATAHLEPVAPAAAPMTIHELLAAMQRGLQERAAPSSPRGRIAKAIHDSPGFAAVGAILPARGWLVSTFLGAVRGPGAALGSNAAKEEGFTATIALGEVEIEVECWIKSDGQMWFAAHARDGSTDASVEGVRLTVTARLEDGQEKIVLDRSTDRRGTILDSSFKPLQNTSYAVEVSHGERRWSFT